jgi:L-arabinokinase
MRLIGEILFQSHIAYTDCGLGSDDCDDLVSRTRQAGLPGAKMTGGGAGGVVAVLGRSEDFDTIQQVVQEYSAGRGSVARIFNGSSDGVDAFGVRVLYPTSSR